MGSIQTILLTMLLLGQGEATTACATLLERTDGTTAPLVEATGKPVVIFYEDRWSTAVNQRLKDELYARGRASGRLDRVRIVPVANIRRYDFFPARGIATAFIRAVESRVGVPILLDVRGQLSAPPLALPAEGASVVLLDAACTERFRHTGPLGAADRERFFSVLEAVLRETGDS